MRQGLLLAVVGAALFGLACSSDQAGSGATAGGGVGVAGTASGSAGAPVSGAGGATGGAGGAMGGAAGVAGGGANAAGAVADCTNAPASVFCQPLAPLPLSIKATGLFPSAPDLGKHPSNMLEYVPDPPLW